MQIPMVNTQSTQSVLQLIAALILLCTILPIMLIWVVIMCPIVYYLFVRNLKTSTEIRRLVQLSATPVLSNITELCNGLSSINVYKIRDVMDQKFLKLMTISVSTEVHEKLTQTQ